MFRRITTALLTAGALSGLLFGCAMEADPAPAPTPDVDIDLMQHGDPIPNQYIVVFQDGAMNLPSGLLPFEDIGAWVQGEAEGLLIDNAMQPEAVQRVYGKALEGFSVVATAADAERLANDWRVKYIEQDRVISLNDPGSLAPPAEKGKPGGGGSDPQVTPWGIARVGGAANSNGTAWIIDTGIDLDHPDLNVDASRGFSAFTSRRDSTPEDGNGHGSHVSGTIAAIDNDIGVVGVAAGATVIPVKVLDSNGSGTTSGVISGVDYVAANGSNGDVANMSLGGGASSALDDAVINAAGAVTFTLAAGNSGAHASTASPARANGNGIFTISAIDSNDNLASFSNYGNPPVDYAAPGVSVFSSYKDGGYATLSGTSMAAPHAAGVFLRSNGTSDGTAGNDPDGNPDPILHL